MGHEKLLVEGIILDSNAFGESGRVFKILTKDFGVVTVVATGVREMQSKMRNSLDILNLVDFEFVEGKEMNRLVGIFLKEKLFFNETVENIIEKRRAVSNVVNFILRTVVGNTHNDKLWESFLNGIKKINEEEKNTKTYFLSFEIIWLIQILISLGYWEIGKYDNFSDENFSILNDEENRKKIVGEINESIKSTHL